MSKACYIIQASGGEWEDSYVYNVSAFLDKSKAELRLFELNHELQLKKEANDLILEADRIASSNCANCHKSSCEECPYDNCDEEYEEYSYHLDEQNPYTLTELELVE